MQGVEPAHSDRRINFDLGAHPRGAVEDALHEGALGSDAHILFREAGLQGRDLPHRADLAPGFWRTAVDDARLVEMDVRLDQASTGKASSRVVGFRCTRQPSLNRDDPASDNADIERLSQQPIDKAGVTN